LSRGEPYPNLDIVIASETKRPVYSVRLPRTLQVLAMTG
jgi:hypothetical protein